MVRELSGVGFEVVVGVDGVVGGAGAVADAVQDGGGHEGAVKEGGAALWWGWGGHVLGVGVVVPGCG